MATVRSKSRIRITRKKPKKKAEAKLGSGMAERARKKIKGRKSRLSRAIKRAGG